jgi:DNA replication protein DnaC
MKKLETKSTVLLKHHLKALKMPTMHDECEKIAARCAKENVDHLGFLLQLCEQELLDREKRAADRRLKAARFPNYKTLEDFRFEAQPTINRVLIGELMRGAYLEKRESVIFIGHPGTGKTHLATALGIAACGLGKKVRFDQWTEVLGSQRLTGAVLDRLTHHCHILEATGESYRLKDARKRSAKRKKPSVRAKSTN